MALTLPAIKTIKSYNSKTIVHVFCSNKNHKIIKNFQYIDRIINIDSSIEKNTDKYDYVFNFSPGWKSFLVCFNLKSKIKASIILTSRYRNKFYSKLFLLYLSKIFFTKTYFINRIDYFENDKSIHQTDLMISLIKQFNFLCKENPKIEIFLPRYLTLKSKRKICLIHLSSKWIHKYYNEDKLIDLISKINKKFNIALSTDETTSLKFIKIYKNFQIIKDSGFKEFKELEEITIFDKLNFTNWTQLIYSSSLVITPECGCTHVAAICKIPSKIIYDNQNKPEMIYAEYSPWNSRHEKFNFGDTKLNNSLIENL